MCPNDVLYVAVDPRLFLSMVARQLTTGTLAPRATSRASTPSLLAGPEVFLSRSQGGHYLGTQFFYTGAVSIRTPYRPSSTTLRNSPSPINIDTCHTLSTVHYKPSHKKEPHQENSSLKFSGEKTKILRRDGNLSSPRL